MKCFSIKTMVKLVVLAFSFTVSMCAFASVSAKTSSTDEGIFLVQAAQHVVLKPGKLTLIEPNAKVLWFANAPSSAAGFYSLDHYLNFWLKPNAYFMADNPNATLIGYFKNQKTHREQRLTLVMTLHGANLSADGQNLTYDVTKTLLIPDNTAFNQVVTLNHPTLLIDDIPTGGNSQFGPIG